MGDPAGAADLLLARLARDPQQLLNPIKTRVPVLPASAISRPGVPLREQTSSDVI